MDTVSETVSSSIHGIKISGIRNGLFFDTPARLDTPVQKAPFLIRSIEQYQKCGIMIPNISSIKGIQDVS